MLYLFSVLVKLELWVTPFELDSKACDGQNGDHTQHRDVSTFGTTCGVVVVLGIDNRVCLLKETRAGKEIGSCDEGIGTEHGEANLGCHVIREKNKHEAHDIEQNQHGRPSDSRCDETTPPHAQDPKTEAMDGNWTQDLLSGSFEHAQAA